MHFVRRDLGKRFGSDMTYIWAIGLLAAGQSSTLTGTYCGQIAMEGFMELKVPKWIRNLITRSIAMIPTVAVAAIYAGSSKMDKLNEILNVLQSVQLPFALIPVLYVCSRQDIMGEKFVLQSTFRTVMQSIAAFLLGLNILLVVQQMMGGFLQSASGGVLFIVIVISTAYAAFVIYLLVGPAVVWRAFKSDSPGFSRSVQQMFGKPSEDDRRQIRMEAPFCECHDPHGMCYNGVPKQRIGDIYDYTITDSGNPGWKCIVPPKHVDSQYVQGARRPSSQKRLSREHTLVEHDSVREEGPMQYCGPPPTQGERSRYAQTVGPRAAPRRPPHERRVPAGRGPVHLRSPIQEVCQVNGQDDDDSIQYGIPPSAQAEYSRHAQPVVARVAPPRAPHERRVPAGTIPVHVRSPIQDVRQVNGDDSNDNIQYGAPPSAQGEYGRHAQSIAPTVPPPSLLHERRLPADRIPVHLLAPGQEVAGPPRTAAGIRTPSPKGDSRPRTARKHNYYKENA